ncbi:MAG: cupin domain-containing protein [Acidimicrobiia bacterium]
MKPQSTESQPEAIEPVVVDLNTETLGSGGAVLSLPHGGDLDANLIGFDAGQGVGEHINDDVDVLIVVLSGSGELTIDGTPFQLGSNFLALIPRGCSRSITAGSTGISYMSVHRQRDALAIASPPPEQI